jgi:hypothetical protein
MNKALIITSICLAIAVISSSFGTIITIELGNSNDINPDPYTVDIPQMEALVNSVIEVRIENMENPGRYKEWELIVLIPQLCPALTHLDILDYEYGSAVLNIENVPMALDSTIHFPGYKAYYADTRETGWYQYGTQPVGENWGRFDIGNPGWVSFHFNVDAPHGTPVFIGVHDKCIPEPMTLSLLGLGALSLIRRKKTINKINEIVKGEIQMKKLITICLVALVVLFATYPVQATITGVALGTAPPPSTLGPYTMTAFDPDPQPHDFVTSVASPLGGTVDFSIPLYHSTVGYDWATWSHGYLGDVYATYGPLSVMLTMPSDTVAFDLYAEPNPMSDYLITATSRDGTSVAQMVSGMGGACGYGFWADGSDLIVTISVACDGADFAVGEFGIAPEPATICLLGLGALSLIRRKK